MKSISITEELSTWTGTRKYLHGTNLGRYNLKHTEVLVQYLVLLEEFFEVVGAGGENTAVSPELDVFDHHGDVTVLALEPLLIQKLQEDALVFVIHVLDCLCHLLTRKTTGLVIMES